MKRKLKLTFVALTIIYRTTLLANYSDWLYPKKRFWVKIEDFIDILYIIRFLYSSVKAAYLVVFTIILWVLGKVDEYEFVVYAAVIDKGESCGVGTWEAMKALTGDGRVASLPTCAVVFCDARDFRSLPRRSASVALLGSALPSNTTKASLTLNIALIIAKLTTKSCDDEF